MKFRKVLLFFMIVSFGLIVEGIHQARTVFNDESSDGFRGFRALRSLRFDGDSPFSKFRGPSYDFTESQTTDAAGITAIEIANEFGDVTIRRTSDPKAQIGIGLRKEVFTRRSESAESISDKVKLVIKREGGQWAFWIGRSCNLFAVFAQTFDRWDIEWARQVINHGIEKKLHAGGPSGKQIARKIMRNDHS